MPLTKESQRAWLNQSREEILDPAREIIDPHHHLWRHSGLPEYLLADLWEDTQSGHNIVKTVFMECGAEYRQSGPGHLKAVGETEFVRAAAAASAVPGKAEIAGIVAHADLDMDQGLLKETLQAHETAGNGLFKGIRHGGAHDPGKNLRWMNATPHADLFSRDRFRRGVALLGDLGYSYDSWHYHFQNDAFTDLAIACSGTTIVLDHFGTPCGVGDFAGDMAAVFDQWKAGISRMAQCPNVVVKIGGLAMPVNGFGWHKQDRPPTSDEVVAAHRDYYLHTIDAFGPSRCMFESNFPVDKRSLSYDVYWNAMKKIAEGFSAEEQHALFYGTAERIYRLG
jgi:predicted TIM-barrel fold metal-dependent hydrolase